MDGDGFVSQRRLEDRIDGAQRLADKHELELHGERGVYATLREVADQLKWVNRALWGIAASVITAAVVIILQGSHP